MKQTFLDLDISGTGSLNKFDLQTAFKEITGQKLDDEALEKVFNMVDVDKDGQISYTEFKIAAIKKEDILDERMIENAFKIFDKDGNGSICVEEI